LSRIEDHLETHADQCRRSRCRSQRRTGAPKSHLERLYDHQGSNERQYRGSSFLLRGSQRGCATNLREPSPGKHLPRSLLEGGSRRAWNDHRCCEGGGEKTPGSTRRARGEGELKRTALNARRYVSSSSTASKRMRCCLLG
jgi:hypothetical protein